MKMIEDLGMQLATNGKRKMHYAIYECPLCHKPFRARVAAIKNGQIKACRCNVVKMFIERNTTHGLVKHPLYSIFKAMEQRCYNSKNKQYPYYGGRGIIICAEWYNNFITFYNWSLSHGYSIGLLIDREDNNKYYSPDNCRWVTSIISNENTRLLRDTNTSGYRGVSYIKTGKRMKRWVAEIHSEGEKYRLGYHLTAESAAQAYNDFVIAHGTAHPLNIIN
jgi:hypothetical protein